MTAMLMAGLSLAGPVAAVPEVDKHCTDHETVLKKDGSAVAAGATGSFSIGGTTVNYTIGADGKSVTFSQAVDFCVKASTENSGLQSGTTYTVDFLNPGEQFPGISYFVVYGLAETEPTTGSITIRKNSVPDNDDDFHFTTTGAGLTDFSLDDDADPTLPRERTFTDLAPGTYTVTEAVLAPWTLTQLDCSAGGTGVVSLRKATIVLTAGAHVTCTFVNTKNATTQQGSITIVKDATPDSAQDFAFTTTGSGLVGFSLDDDADGALSNQITFTGLALGSYTVTEAETAGWTLATLTCSTGGSGDTATRTATINLVAGAHVTCTFGNAPTTTTAALGSITIVKNAEPNSPQDFGFTTTGSGLSAFSLDDDGDATLANSRTFSNLAAGTYTVTESAVEGWSLSQLTCTSGGSGDAATRTATIVLAAGANVTCTFDNTQQRSGNLPSTGGPSKPREGTQAGLPNTALAPAAVPSSAALVAMLMVVVLGAVAGTALVESRRRS